MSGIVGVCTDWWVKLAVGGTHLDEDWWLNFRARVKNNAFIVVYDLDDEAGHRIIAKGQHSAYGSTLFGLHVVPIDKPGHRPGPGQWRPRYIPWNTVLRVQQWHAPPAELLDWLCEEARWYASTRRDKPFLLPSAPWESSPTADIMNIQRAVNKERLFAQHYSTPAVDWKIPGSVTGRFNASSPPETFTLRTLDKIAQWMWPEQPLPSEERVCRTLRGCLEEGGCTTPISCTEMWNRCKPLWFIKEKP